MSDDDADPIAIAGAGAFGTALSIVLGQAGRQVVLWARNTAHASRLSDERCNRVHLPDCPLPDCITPTSDLGAVRTATTILIVVPAQATRAVARQLSAVAPADADIVACAKGIEQETGAFQSDILAAELPDRTLSVLSGPGYAGEIAAGKPTAMTLAAATIPLATRICGRLATPAFRPYSSTDIRGVELGGALKNVIAIACGIVIGRGLGESARAALLTRGLAEIARLSATLGGRPETLSGLSGLGDLVLTAMSEQSRNTRYGIALGRSGDPRTVAAAGMALAEGVHTAPVAVQLAEQHDVDMPITFAVAGILAGQISVDDAIERLVRRPLRSEDDHGN